MRLLPACVNTHGSLSLVAQKKLNHHFGMGLLRGALALAGDPLGEAIIASLKKEATLEAEMLRPGH